MAPLTKDTLEVANPAGEAAVSHASNQTKPASGHMRSDAVSLEVPVRVHGSKVTEVVLGTTPHTEPFEEQTSTMIIFPQGGVLRMNTPVTVGQMLVLTNLKSRQDAICRVVKVRPNAKLAAYIEVEFTQRQQGFWGVAVPGDADEAASSLIPPAPASSARSEFKQKPESDISWASAPSTSVSTSPAGANSISREIEQAEAPAPPVQRFVPADKAGAFLHFHRIAGRGTAGRLRHFSRGSQARNSFSFSAEDSCADRFPIRARRRPPAVVFDFRIARGR